MIKIVMNGVSSEVEYFVFSGGEVQTKINQSSTYLLPDYIRIDAKLQNSDDVMALLQVNEILKRSHPNIEIYLDMHYAPYARQDRVCAIGESLSCKVFANLINSCNFSRVYVSDCHSDVLPALLNNCHNIPLSVILVRSHLSSVLHSKSGFIISPDAGANKKVFDVCKLYTNQVFVRADKTRDAATGKITGTEVFHDDFEGKPCYILDDICDGGYTFVKLAEKLKEKNAGKITLFVTHGIFSKGLEVFDGLIDQVWTTDSFESNVSHKNLVTVPL